MNSIRPKVSVIIPTYNRADQLRICLKSLQEQSLKNFEVIVCDDGSTDNTNEIVDEFKDLLDLIYIQDINFGGPARPRNNGLKQAKGEIIAFLDSDDWWYPYKLENSLKYFDDYDVVYHNLNKYERINKSHGVLRGRSLKGDFAKDLIINGNAIPNSSVLVRKEIIDIVGEITEDKNLIAVEDSDYWIRIAQVTKRFKFINDSFGAYWQGDNISVSEKQILRESALFNKHKYLLDSDETVYAMRLLALRKARIFHKLNKFDDAKNEYLISFELSSFLVKLKSFVGLILCLFKINA